MQDDWEKRMAERRRSEEHERNIGGGARFGEAPSNPPRGGTSGVKPPPRDTMGAADVGKLASTFAAHLSDQAEFLPAGAPRAWLQGLIALSRAVAATAAELEGEP